MSAGPLASSPPTVSVVMPTRGSGELVVRSLLAALADPATFEAIVVLDRPEDCGDSEKIVDQLAALDPRVRVVRVGSQAAARRGQSARDDGARAARGELIVALDDDVVAHVGTISGHAGHHAVSSGLVVVGYMPVVEAASRGFRRAPARFYSASYERECSRFRSDSSSILKRLWAGNLSVRRADWIAAAEISHGRGGYHDDRAFGLALEELGLRAVFAPELRADHSYSRSIAEFVRDARDSAVGERHLGLADGDAPLGGYRRLKRLLRWSSRWRGTWAFGVAAAGAVALVASAARFGRGEEVAASVLWLLGRERGFHEIRDQVPMVEN
jgi:glycosyltransferase involved in cell wall biosynthesis